MEEWRNGGMEEWRNGGMEEWRNGGMEEWEDSGENRRHAPSDSPKTVPGGYDEQREGLTESVSEENSAEVGVSAEFLDPVVVLLAGGFTPGLTEDHGV
jgi:hypothetical protein